MSTSPSTCGRVSDTGIPATIASNARSDGGGSQLTALLTNACSTFDRSIPGTLPACVPHLSSEQKESMKRAARYLVCVMAEMQISEIECVYQRVPIKRCATNCFDVS